MSARPRPRKYRVTYLYDNGMSNCSVTETFTAYSDLEAKMQAREVAGRDIFELEAFRRIKV